MAYNRDTRITSCNNCIFAVNTPQTDCQHNRLEKFRNAGYNVVIGYDGYYHIHNAVCNLFSDDPNDTVDGAIERNKTSVSIVIYMDVDDPIGLDITLNSIKQHNHVYEQIIIVTSAPSNTINLKEYKTWIEQNKLAKETIIRYVLGGKDKKECWDHGFQKCKSMYTMFVDVGYSIPTDYYDKLDSNYNELMRKFVMVKPDNQCSVLTVANIVYRALGGETGIDPTNELPDGIVSRIEYMARLEHNEHLITSYEYL